MFNKRLFPVVNAKLITALLMMFFSGFAQAADVELPGVSVTFSDSNNTNEVANALKILLTLTVLSIAPAILIVMTSFTRIIIVLSMLRLALGMQQTPPNTVIISLALFLTVFNMMPVIQDINTNSFTPFMEGKVETKNALDEAMKPLRNFMIRQTREQDLALMLDISKSPVPDSIDEVSSFMLIPAFMLSELKTAFQIGFIIFLPFLLIDIVVASILMSMGMMMVPPMMISLPVKILMFVLIDGWNLVVQSLMNSFN